MAEELEAGAICGANWWLNSPKNLFFAGCLSPCSSVDGKTSSRSFFNEDSNFHGDGTTIGSSTMDSSMKSEFDYSTSIYTDSNKKTSSQEYLGQQTIPKFCNDSFESSTNPSSYAITSSLLENLFDGDSSYMMNQNQEYFGNLGIINSTHLPEHRLEDRSTFSDFPAMLVSLDQSQFLPQYNKGSHNPKFKSQNHVEEAMPVRKNSSNDNQPKRQRIETPSPLPTFKVRKEKLGDRVTALQQLVSPFGKTDTASVLHEAIEYIKFLHTQVNLLSAPYFNSEDQHQQTAQEITKQGLRSRGLCLMPISVSYPVATEASSSFWVPPPFERNFR